MTCAETSNTRYNRGLDEPRDTDYIAYIVESSEASGTCLCAGDGHVQQPHTKIYILDAARLTVVGSLLCSLMVDEGSGRPNPFRDQQ